MPHCPTHFLSLPCHACAEDRRIQDAINEMHASRARAERALLDLAEAASALGGEAISRDCTPGEMTADDVAYLRQVVVAGFGQ